MATTAPPPIRVALLGPVLVEGRDGALVEPGGKLAKALITALALADGRGVSSGALIDELWEDNPPSGAKAALQTLVSRVRSACAPGLLESTPSGYLLAIGPDESDLGRARLSGERAATALRTGDPALALDLATDALRLWRGQPGRELEATDLGDAIARRAAPLTRDLGRVRAQSRLELGESAEVVTELEALAAESPLDDAVHLMLFNAYAQSGRRTDAMRLFGAYRERLRDELGANPPGELLEAHTALLRDEAPTGWDDGTASRYGGPAATGSPATPGSSAAPVEPAAPTPPGSTGSVRIGLRTPPNELIGREADLEAVEALIADARVTTILGPGGLGKTRLAQEIGRRATATTPAVVFVELASVRNADDLPLAVATTLGIREVSGPRRVGESLGGLAQGGIDLRSRIITALSERPTLLIIDNCEHLVDAAARWIADLLDWIAELRVLATSRSPLAIAAEYVYQLDSLSSEHSASADPSGNTDPSSTSTITTDGSPDPSAYGPAVTLFAERAKAARPAAVIPLDTVARLCTRLDGLPLAIELAAARVRSLSVDEIERRLSNRFDLLTSGDRNAPERHRTLLAVIDWSWNLLDERERVVLRRVSQFPDGFSFDAAEAVSGDLGAESGIGGPGDLDGWLGGLVNQSLITVQDDTRTGTLRYRLLETVREFGGMALIDAGEDEFVRERTRAWAVAFSHRTLPLVQGAVEGADQVAALSLVQLEQDNLVGVLREAIEDGRADIVAPVFAVLTFFWSIRSAHSEVLAFGETVLNTLRAHAPSGWAAETTDAVASCYAVIGATMLVSGRRAGARAISELRRHQRSYPVHDARLGAITAMLLESGRPERAFALLEHYRSADDPRVAGIGNLISAQLAENDGNGAFARRTAERAFELANETGDVWGAAMSSLLLAQLHSEDADHVAALAWAERSAIRLRALASDEDLRQLDWIIGINHVSDGDFETSAEIFERFLIDDGASPDFSPFRERRSIGFTGLAEIARANGETARGLELYGSAIEAFGTSTDRRSPWFVMVAACAISAYVLDGQADEPSLPDTVRRLRTRTLARRRAIPGAVDKPVLGTAAVALGCWYLRSGEAPVRDIGLELLGLAERLESRQDVPSLHRAPHWREAGRIVGDEAIATTRAATALLDTDESAARVFELLGSPALAAR